MHGLIAWGWITGRGEVARHPSGDDYGGYRQARRRLRLRSPSLQRSRIRWHPAPRCCEFQSCCSGNTMSTYSQGEWDLQHGFLLSQFLSPHTNRRTDDYGGSPEGRLRLLQRIVAEVREACPPPFCLSVKLNSGDYMAKGGLTQDEALDQVKWLVTCGMVDMVEISGGNGEQATSKLHSTFRSPLELFGFLFRSSDAISAVQIRLGRNRSKRLQKSPSPLESVKPTSPSSRRECRDSSPPSQSSSAEVSSDRSLQGARPLTLTLAVVQCDPGRFPLQSRYGRRHQFRDLRPYWSRPNGGPATGYPQVNLVERESGRRFGSGRTPHRQGTMACEAHAGQGRGCGSRHPVLLSQYEEAWRRVEVGSRREHSFHSGFGNRGRVQGRIRQALGQGF